MTSPGAVALIGGALVVAAIIPQALGDRLPFAKCAPCDLSDVLWFDRVSIGEFRRQPSLVSWGTLIATVAGSIVLLASGQDTSVTDEQREYQRLTYTVLTAGALTGWLKVAFHRPRPILYTDQAGLYATRDNGRSMPSGHASIAFAFAVGTATMIAQRGTNEKTGVALLLTGATATSVLRVVARRHFPSDVTAGALLGTLVGLVVPRVTN